MPHPNHPNLAGLIADIKNGFIPDFVFFWKPEPKVEGEVDPSCLCQWWLSPFELEGVVYQTAEHYMMAEKARLSGDEEAYQRILSSPSPHDAKRLGRGVQGFDEKVWVAHRFEIVVHGNLAKFNQNYELRKYLFGTGESVLVEASPIDRIWGIGLAEDDPRVTNPQQWQGLNLLGFALMTVRSMLR